MGWMNRASRLKSREHTTAEHIDYYAKKSELSPSVTFIEDSSSPKLYQKVSVDTKNHDLPFIEASTVTAAGEDGLVWIVIDDIVYDCTEFVHDHPGGSRVLSAFQSSNCSWQFRRFHREKDMLEFGVPLRIGRTSGIHNRFKEPPRFVGLRKLWGSD